MSSFKTPWTKTLTGTSLQITSNFGFVALSVLCVSGTITILGNCTINGVAGDAITLSSGQGFTFGNNDGSTLILNGITIDATGGVAALGAQ